MSILHLTTTVDIHVLLTCYCGPMKGWRVPKDLLRLVLEYASILRVGRHTLRFEIYFPTNVKCPTKKGHKAKKKGGGGRKRWMAAVMKEYRKNKSGGLGAAMRRAKQKYKK